MKNNFSFKARLETLKKKIAQNVITLRQRIKKGVMFQFQPFSQKQLQVLTWWNDNSPVKSKDGIICDGSIRAGKTLSMSFSFILWSMTNFNGQNFIMAGKTIGSFRRNVIFWLKLILKAQGYGVKERRADNLLEITKNDKINFYYIFGGKDEKSQDLVQGITAAGCLLDEVALMPESFVNQVIARCSVAGSKFWFNCNPAGPKHWFKLNWIDKCKEKNLIYIHFTMDDNLSLSEETKERYRKLFTGVFYQRYILGLWVSAEGVIYKNFSEEKHVIKAEEVPKFFDAVYVTSDYGITNPQVYLLCGIKRQNGVPHVYILKEYYNVGKDENNNEYLKTDEIFYQDYIKFTANYDILQTIIDPSAKSLINLFKEKGIRVKPANNDVIDGINVVLSWLEDVRIHIVEGMCPNLISEFYSYLWDEKAKEKGEDAPLKIYDHAMDALRYLLNTLFPTKRRGVFFPGQGV